MLRVSDEIRELERESYRIVGMICSETVPADDLDGAIDRLRQRTAKVFPDRPQVFEETYGRRFQRLRTRFQPRGGLFPTGRMA